MIIVEIIGGLGNQMFQYAAAWALAQSKKTQLKLDIAGFANYPLHQGFEIGKVFRAPADIASEADVKVMLGWQSGALVKRILRRPSMAPWRRSALHVESHFHYSDLLSETGSDAYLCGYWQSEKYFIPYEKSLRQQFQFRQPLNFTNQKWADMILRKNAVSVHIRRGDFIDKKNISIHGACTVEYFTAAIKNIVARIPEAEFFIFSDDAAWAKENLNIESPHYFVENNTGADSFNDMHLMSLCRHNIIANSSFSWWGAWLNSNSSKIVIAPKRWFSNNLDTRDLLPKDWLVL